MWDALGRLEQEAYHHPTKPGLMVSGITEE